MCRAVGDWSLVNHWIEIAVKSVEGAGSYVTEMRQTTSKIWQKLTQKSVIILQSMDSEFVIQVIVSCHRFMDCKAYVFSL